MTPDLTCKGDWRLGTACGVCHRCIKSAPSEIRALKADLEMYQRAWIRELGIHLHNKSHLIDALVLSTRDLREKADRFDREHGQDLPKWKYAALAAPWFGEEVK